MTDLWPDDIASVEQKAPVAILREQAALLGTKTQNLVTGEVRLEFPGVLSPEYLTAEAAASQERLGTRFRYVFYIVAPALQDYRFELFSITHYVDLYPVTLFIDSDTRREMGIDPAEYSRVIAPTEERLVDYLRYIFSSTRTKRVVRTILAQSEGYASEGLPQTSPGPE